MDNNDYVKLALPKGKLLPATSCFLNEVELGFNNYNEETRIYRLSSASIPNLTAKIFQEKDIPVQVAVGNYDFGICGLDWIEELLTRYPASNLIKVANLEYDKGNIYLAAGLSENMADIGELIKRPVVWRIATEYPNLAEALCLDLRLKAFKIFPVWGSAEAYPPENAELIVIRAQDEKEVKAKNLHVLKKLFASSAFLIANRESMQNKNISGIVSLFSNCLKKTRRPWLEIEQKPVVYENGSYFVSDEDVIWLAVPDGHQKKPTVAFLNKAGIFLKGYSGTENERRPISTLNRLKVKVIRPQDMPLQVANGNFDLAITGKDWLLDHMYQFPPSPVTKLANLGFANVRMVAVVHNSMPASNIHQLMQGTQKGKTASLKVASEYINIADKYLRDNHVWQYKLIPTWGASEALLPEDADLLIENTETGKTLAQNNLKIIDTLFQSSACLIGNKTSIESPDKKEYILPIIEKIRQAAKST
jgi:ATP phosphoribosyltransferase